MTPKEQEPIQNDDSMITLSGSGSYEHHGSKYTILNGIVINNDGTIDMSFPDNIGKEITIESPDGSITAFDKNGDITIDGRSMNDIINDSLGGLNNIDWSYANNLPWTNYTEENNLVYETSDGTKIILLESSNITINMDVNVIFEEKILIEFKNGVKIEAPSKTKIEFENSSYIFTIGNGEGKIIKSDTEDIVSSGTIIDSEGNIIG